MSDEQEVTLGEVFRGLGRVERVVEDGFKAVNDRIDNMRSEFVPRELYESELETIRDSIKESRLAPRYWISVLLPAVFSCAALLTSILH